MAGLIQAVVVAQAVRLALIRPESLQGAQIRRQAADDDIARIDEHTGNQVERLLRSGRDLDVLDRNVQILVPLIELGNLLAQGKDTLRRAILQGGVPFGIENILHDGLQLLQRKCFRIRKTSGKRDDLGAGGYAEQIADLGPAHTERIV